MVAGTMILEILESIVNSSVFWQMIFYGSPGPALVQAPVSFPTLCQADHLPICYTAFFARL
jgi:hypothetical protein